MDDDDDIGDANFEEEAKNGLNFLFDIPKMNFPEINLPSPIFHEALLANAMPKFDVTALVRTGIVPSFDFGLVASMKENLKGFVDLSSLIEPIVAHSRIQIGALLAGFKESLDDLILPNWREVDHPEWEDILGMLLDEGLALAWTPPAAVLSKLFAAKSPADRRRVIGRNWRIIVTDCREQLDAVSSDEGQKAARFGILAADAILEGHTEAGQALAANLLETILRGFDDAERIRITSHRSRPDVGSYGYKEAIVFAGIWGAFGVYRPERNDPIPASFSRHATAHAVSRRQFSRINAVIALTHVTALLRLVEGMKQ